jgi:hypothetical protein
VPWNVPSAMDSWASEQGTHLLADQSPFHAMRGLGPLLCDEGITKAFSLNQKSQWALESGPLRLRDRTKPFIDAFFKSILSVLGPSDDPVLVASDVL